MLKFELDEIDKNEEFAFDRVEFLFAGHLWFSLKQ